MRAFLIYVSLVFILLNLVTLVMADQYIVQYDIQDTVRVAVTVDIANRGSEYRIYLPLDAENIVEEQNIPYSLVTLSDRKVAVFDTSSLLSSSLALHYTTRELVDENTFVASNHVADAGRYTLSVILPEAVILETPLGSQKPSIFPHPSRVESDGQRLRISWEDLGSDEPVLIKFKEDNARSRVIIWGLIVVVCIVGIFGYVVKYKKNKKNESNTKEEQKETQQEPILISLYDEEQKIVDALNAAPSHELWQKDLLQKTALTKVKLSRRLRSLEQRGLIEKIPYGNTNKIRIKNNSEKAE